MNYWFLYTIADGKIYGSPYLGEVEEWTNIPGGCGILGPIPETDDAAKEASANPDWYTVQNGQLTPVPDIEARRQQQEIDRNKPQPPSADDRIKALEDAMTAMMGL